MKNLMTLVLMSIPLLIIGQTQTIEGKWISESEATGEVMAYEFFNNRTLKIFIDGEEFPSVPIEYKLVTTDGRTEIELEYLSAWNNSTEKMYGLIEFLEEGKIKMEFFPFDEQVGKKNDFSDEALLFVGG